MSVDSERILYLRAVLKEIEKLQAEARDDAERADLGRRAVRAASEIIRLKGSR
jgi:hypothetical protein